MKPLAFVCQGLNLRSLLARHVRPSDVDQGGR